MNKEILHESLNNTKGAFYPLNENQFIKALKKHNIHLSDEQKDQFATYYQLLVEWNQKVNLTALTEKEDVYLKHFYDSITPAFYIDFMKQNSLCDVGAGAGFPSIPLKICFPHLQMTIVDSLKKRVDFLQKLTDELQLKNVTLHHSRAEDFGQNKKFRESFDMVIARAVARMSVLSELCLPLVQIGGKFIAMKGSKAKDELTTARTAINRLGGKFLQNYSFHLPSDTGERSILVIDKQHKTPKKFPRKPGTPQRKPIK